MSKYQPGDIFFTDKQTVLVILREYSEVAHDGVAKIFQIKNIHSGHIIARNEYEFDYNVDRFKWKHFPCKKSKTR